jgi:tRNA-dihydrouridine synthase
MSKVPAHWERVKRAVEIRNELNSKTLIVGNGDLWSLEDAKQKVQQSGADGAMLGRAIFGKPWLFSDAATPPLARSGPLGQVLPSLRESQLSVLVEHTKLFEELLGEVKNFAIMKKHFKAYCEGFPGAKELRMKLMEAENAHAVEQIVGEFLSG